MTTDPFTEEPWEADLGAMLAGLPPVEPPAGFIDGAIDHRPLGAGRILGGLLAATIALVGLVAATGVIERSAVVPPIDDLVARHDLAARAGLPADEGAASSAEVHSPFALPDGFRREGTLAAEDLRQAVYARGDESVSVFVQDGPVAWSALPDGGRAELGGLPAWVDGDRGIAIIETGGSTVTVVGMDREELDRVLEGVPRSSSGLGTRFGELAEALAETFGYAPAG